MTADLILAIMNLWWLVLSSVCWLTFLRRRVMLTILDRLCVNVVTPVHVTIDQYFKGINATGFCSGFARH